MQQMISPRRRKVAGPSPVSDPKGRNHLGSTLSRIRGRKQDAEIRKRARRELARFTP